MGKINKGLVEIKDNKSPFYNPRNESRYPLYKGHAVAVLLVTPQGIPLIRDPKKPAPIFWKLPGGRGDETETARSCAIRELQEELGISLSESNLVVVHSEDKGSHILTIFRANLTSSYQMKLSGDEGEEIRMFKPCDILAKQDFFSNHRKIVGKILSGLCYKTLGQSGGSHTKTIY